MLKLKLLKSDKGYTSWLDGKPVLHQFSKVLQYDGKISPIGGIALGLGAIFALAKDFLIREKLSTGKF